MDEFVDQLNLCDLVIMPSFGLLDFSQNKYLGTSFISKYFNFPKTGAKTYFKQELYQNYVFIKL
jgi:hypothetical protein